ncbi:hypothetical protein LTR62_004822 [Meristemomyces frigidus]|uniref:Uncharacterized protein n=1 Tax=Meristemomyces frigidus TaxID=1508187 RepID=A0AAN7TLF5_9PEZI|nr:hypothetical protein LTR62_004822 [Meristemomyces frigidus]
MDPNTQRNIIYGVCAVAAGFAAYQVYVNMTASQATSAPSFTPSSSAKPSASRSAPAAAAPKKPAYTPKGEPESWSEEDMKKFLTSRNLATGHGSHPARNELLAMVESKLHEPTSTGFSDPEEWSAEDMREYLQAHGVDVPHHSGRMELLAMVESKMHEPK